jgi:diguanylate cyclase (GGDEF)-like protein
MADDEIPSELIKLAILRLVKSKNNGEYKWNLLAGLAHGPSLVEISLGITFNPPTKYRASVCFDELRRDGYVLPFDNSNTNPDDWVKITEKGLKALEDGVVNSQSRVESLGLSHFGIPDLRVFKSEVSALKNQDLVSCVFMDLDNFKSVNDQHDHSVGDQVIQEAIRITEVAVRGKGKVFHRSGDEIVILLQNFSPEEACAVAERIRRTIEEHDFSVIGKGFVTATLGVSTCPTFCTLQELEVSADKAAMAAKTKGKNQVVHSGVRYVAGESGIISYHDYAVTPEECDDVVFAFDLYGSIGLTFEGILRHVSITPDRLRMVVDMLISRNALKRIYDFTDLHAEPLFERTLQTDHDDD